MKSLVNRKPVVKGRFYPGPSDELKKMLFSLFSTTKKPDTFENIRAIIAPHAGYVYSGEIAANAYMQINPISTFETIFILAPSHHVSFQGASIYQIGNYETPLGEVNVNTDLSNQLIENCPYFFYLPQAHQQEHSLEVQLPFLQYHLKTAFSIVPIVLGTNKPEILKEISKHLKPYFNEKNLFIISSDFSHFPNYEDAIIADMNTAEAIEKNSINEVIKSVELNKKLIIKNLATSACGLSGIITLLHLTENEKELCIKAIKYKNSGDVASGDHERVVGYWAFKVIHCSLDTDFSLTKNEKATLLSFARSSLESYLKKNRFPKFTTILSEALIRNTGVFVSLHHGDSLRGCIGRFESDEPLYKLVQKMAVASATSDNRFEKVSLSELSDINIEISVLTPLKKIHAKDEIEIGRHGIYIKQGLNHGTLLPQVATENNWSVDEFLGYCAKNKARIGWDGWKNAELYTYEAIVFSEHL